LKKNHIWTRGTWVDTWGLCSRLAPTWRLGLASVLTTLLRTRGAWVLLLCWTRPCATWCLGPASVLAIPLRPRGVWAICLGLGTTQRTHCACVTHARAPLGDTWRLGSATWPKRNWCGFRTQDQWVSRQDPIIIGSSINTQGSWVLGF
jgi:hypothetical protein